MPSGVERLKWPSSSKNDEPAERSSVMIWVSPWDEAAYIIMGKLPSGRLSARASRISVHSSSVHAVICPSAMKRSRPALRNISRL